MQSALFDTLVNTSTNLLVCAPTASGKTTVLELGIIRQLQLGGKIAYVAPTKSLCQEKLHQWSKYGACEYTSDAPELKDGPVLVCTPEKLEYEMRHGGLHISLLLLDEVHFLNDSRGAILEILRNRVKCRIIGVSATIPNPKEVAEWLDAELRVFGDEYRPVPLKRVVKAYKEQKNMYYFDKYLTQFLPKVIQEYSDNKPVLIFCNTRKGVESTCDYLKEHFSGVGFHHAGLNMEKRREIERQFLDNKLRILVSTNTLAVGINLPAHLVIIKSTTAYTDDGLGEINELDLVQMMGRAGRPQFDKEGVVVLMTTTDRVHHYERLVQGSQPVKSQILQRLEYWLLVEISLSMNTRQKIVGWLKRTFYYCQAKPTETDINRVIDKRLKTLADLGLINEYQGNFTITEIGSQFIKYNLHSVESANCIAKHPNLNSIRAVMEYVSSEFKSEYETGWLKSDALTKQNFESTAAQLKIKFTKVNAILINMVNACMGLKHVSKCFDVSIKILKLLIAFQISKKDKNLVFSLQLLQILTAKLLPSTLTTVIREFIQIDKIGPKIAQKLVNGKIKTFDELRQEDPRRIELVTQRKPPFGDTVKKNILKFPRVSLELSQGPSKLLIKLNNLNPAAVNCYFNVVVVNKESLLDYRRIQLAKMKNKSIEIKTGGPVDAYLICDCFIGFDAHATIEEQVEKPAHVPISQIAHDLLKDIDPCEFDNFSDVSEFESPPDKKSKVESLDIQAIAENILEQDIPADKPAIVLGHTKKSNIQSLKERFAFKSDETTLPKPTKKLQVVKTPPMDSQHKIRPIHSKNIQVDMNELLQHFIYGSALL